MNARPTKSGLIRLYRGLKNRQNFVFSPIFICGVAGGGNTLLAALLYERYLCAGFADESALYAPHASPFRMRSSTSFTSVRAFRDAMYVDPCIPAKTLKKYLVVQYQRESTALKASEFIVDKAPNTHMLRVPALRKAFPEGHFIMVYRDPVSHIEGLRRKWQLFRKADLHDVLAFWQSLHETFLEDTRQCQSLVRGVAYEELVAHPDEVLQELALWLKLPLRVRKQTQRIRPNRPGFALRNVVDGHVAIVDDANVRARARAHADENTCRTIEQQLGPMYARLVTKFRLVL